MIKLVLVRHGQSVWNKENKFTGWTDVDLSAKGVEEAKNSGHLLKKENFNFEMIDDSLTNKEIQLADKLKGEKYKTEEWNLQVLTH